MDGYQVEKCQEEIRDNMVVYKNVLECILAITENTSTTNFAQIVSIMELCKTTLRK